jgi:hypothetical protein
MSYSVNFKNNGSGKILLEKVVVDGKEYTPSADTQVFTKGDGGLLSKEQIDLTNIQYAPAGAPAEGVPAGPTKGPIAPTEPLKEPTEPLKEPTEPLKEPTEPLKEPTEPLKEPIAPTKEPTGPIEDPNKAAKMNELNRKKGLLRVAGRDLAGKTDEEVESLYKEYETTAANKAAMGTELLKKLAKIKVEPRPETEGSTAFNSMVDKAPPIPPVTTDAPPKGGSSRKTKRNRRKNKRFVKKSYKRRR